MDEMKCKFDKLSKIVNDLPVNEIINSHYINTNTNITYVKSGDEILIKN